MIGEPQYCAFPVPLSALLSMMSAPPDFTPTRRITKHILPMGDVYAPRKDSIESAKKTRGDIARDKILAVMSNRWMPRSSISALVGMTPDATSRALGWPKDRYQLLCANCNFGKLMNGGTCPHKTMEAIHVA